MLQSFLHYKKQICISVCMDFYLLINSEKSDKLFLEYYCANSTIQDQYIISFTG